MHGRWRTGRGEGLKERDVGTGGLHALRLRNHLNLILLFGFVGLGAWFVPTAPWQTAHLFHPGSTRTTTCGNNFDMVLGSVSQ